MAQSSRGGPTTEESEEERLARIEDPENYVLGRRYKMLLDAKEWVREIDQETKLLLSQDRTFYPEDRAELVSHAVSRYFSELLPMLRRAGTAEEFLSETISLDGESYQIRQLALRRGNVEVGDRSIQQNHITEQIAGAIDEHPDKYIPADAFLQIEMICNEYFEDLAGATFAESSATRTDPF